MHDVVPPWALSMSRLTIAIRATCLVAGIAAFATLANRLIAASDVKLWLLMHQQSLPGSLFASQFAEHCSYGIAAILLVWLVAREYWRELFPQKMRWTVLLGSALVGILFAMFLNHPIHAFLFDAFFGSPSFGGGAVSDTIAAGIFAGQQGWTRILSVSAFATVVLSPFVEELTDRGILFKEAELLPQWQIAVLSLLVFCLSHYAIGGTAKMLAMVPAGLVFVALRLKTGSFIYPAAAHMGVNAVALFKLQVV